jgi:anti-sigma B factor antagonist
MAVLWAYGSRFSGIDEEFRYPEKRAAMSVQTSIFADTESSAAVWIRVEGKGTFQNSPGLKDFSRKMIEDGRHSLVIDLANCPAMDSTFMGTLAGIALRLREAGGGDLWVINRNERNAELLSGLGLDALFSAGPAPDFGGGDGLAIEQNADKAITREVMREAHETAIRVNPRNAAKFRDVIEHLNASAARETGKPPGGKSPGK